MVREPAVFLFDEPLAGLDAPRRSELRFQVRELRRRLGAAMMFATHDQGEAMMLADRLVVMHEGRVMQEGTPHELYARPANVATARFVGAVPMNLLAARIGGDGGIALDAGSTTLPPPVAVGRRRDGALLLGVRAEHLSLGGEAGCGLQFAGVVRALEPCGAEMLVHVLAGDARVVGRVAAGRAPVLGQAVRMGAPVAALHLFDAFSGQVITQ